MRNKLFLFAVVLLACFVIGCDLFESPSDPASRPGNTETENTGAYLSCQDGLPAKGVSFFLNNGYQRIKLETVEAGDDAGLAPPKDLVYEEEYFFTDPPWYVTLQVEGSTGNCSGPVSPLPTCVDTQTLARVPLEWKQHKDYGKYLEANATIICNN